MPDYFVIGAYSDTNGRICIPFVNNKKTWYINVFNEVNPHTNCTNETDTIVVCYVKLS